MMSEKPKAKLTGTDGNVFSIIGRVSSILERANQVDRAKEFVAKAFKAGSYDEVLSLCFDYVEVE